MEIIITLIAVIIAVIIAKMIVARHFYKCTECDHVCSENCIYDESEICLHDCNIDPLVKFEPWG